MNRMEHLSWGWMGPLHPHAARQSRDDAALAQYLDALTVVAAVAMPNPHGRRKSQSQGRRVLSSVVGRHR